MAKRLHIPRLVPDGTRAKVITHVQPRPRQRRRSNNERLTGEPWRKQGYGNDYQKNRQIVIEYQHGRCKYCGKQVATKLKDGRWSCSCGGQVHHKRPLRDGGTSDASNLELVCPSCHYKLDYEMRKKDRG